ncbi:GntR family transcriptional regulator [Microbacterium sp. zg.Y909]|uniref:GntR family transcriptional regulator n=1 Tax=Microbacterium sp. zg.Y909 TaxID=2969413 RepID=UPI00214CCB55|nr:GntR family transcriptional regulator [Microbacterium sp. zg.Y909]MCR2824965.1 GntR family transcriptional regulator [Microbacterium sp. zg.Y909]
MTRNVGKETKADLVRRHLMSVIDAGLPVHEKLPTERELADEFEISRLTVRRALDQLENEGWVYRVQGAGTFVSERTIIKSFELTSFSEDMRSRGMVPGSLPVSVAIVPAGQRISYALNLTPSDSVAHIRRVRTADDAPMCLENAWLPEPIVPGIVGALGESSLYELLEQRYNVQIERADQIIRATVLDPDVAALLNVPAFSPAFLVSRTSYDVRGRAIEYAESLYRGDRYSYELTVQRRSVRAGAE